MRKIGLPRFGIYSNWAKSLLETLGFTVLMPARVTREMIRLGVMNSGDMMCFPYKVMLGQQIWCLEQGAEELLMYNNHGLCRQKHYFDLQMLTLKNLGYTFKMHSFGVGNGISKVIEISGMSVPKIMRIAMSAYNELFELEKKAYPPNNGGGLRIGIIGEIYTVLEHDINLDIIGKLQRMGVSVDVSVKISDFIKHNFLHQEEKILEQEEARSLLTEDMGGHGFHSVYNTIWYGKNGFNGVIHLMPLSCMPEVTVEPVVDFVADKYDIPLYRFPIDENNFEIGVNTRLETFVSMLRRNYR